MSYEEINKQLEPFKLMTIINKMCLIQDKKRDSLVMAMIGIL